MFPRLDMCFHLQVKIPLMEGSNGNLLRAWNHLCALLGEHMNLERKSLRPLALMRLIGLVTILFAGVADAKSSSYSFTMDWREVDGKKNGVTHSLSAGKLTISAEIWVYDQHPGYSRPGSDPEPVTIELFKEVGLFGKEQVCSLTLSPAVERKESNSKQCGDIDEGTYWIKVHKRDTDNFMIKGSGTLTTQ